MTKTGKFIWITFAVLIVAVYFFGLTVPLVGPDEPRYSQIAREMFERGDWITPKLGGFDWFEKPALLYWLQIGFFKIFGVSEFSARFGSALFGLGTVFCLWIIGRKSSGSKDQSEFANWLALIGATSIGLIAFSRGASFDIILTFPITASLTGFFVFDRAGADDQRAKYTGLAAFYFFIGVALIAKGLVGIIFPVSIAAFYYLLRLKIPSRFFFISLIWGTLLALATAAAWYVPMYQTNGWKFIDEFFIQHHFQRYSSNKYQHPQPFWFFWIVLPLMTIPWLPFFLAAVWRFCKSAAMRIKETGVRGFSESSSPLLIFAFSWMLVPLVFFSLSGSKLPGYILPALPAAMIFSGNYVFEFVKGSKLRVHAVQALAFVTIMFVAVLLQFVVPRFVAEDTTKFLLQDAAERGYASEKVINLHTISHNSEFYAAGRLVRADDGKIKKFLGDVEIVDYLNRTGEASVLVLVTPEYLPELENSKSLSVEVLGKNSELVIAVARK